MDIFDEGAHYDYVVRLRDHHIPAWGDFLDQRTLHMAECLGYQVGAKAADCGKHHREPGAFPAGGFSYEAQQPPFGYLPFVVTAKPNADPKAAIAAARQGGALWTAAGAFLLVGLAAVEGLSLLGLTVLLSTCLLSPVHVYAAATVNNDAAGVAAGALVLLVVSISRRRGSSMAALGIAGGVAVVMTKGVFLLAPLVVVLAALFRERPWSASRHQWREAVRRNACPVGMLAGGAAAFLAWVAYQNVRARVPSSVVLHALLGFTHTEHLKVGSILAGLRAQTSLLIPYFGDSPAHYLWNLWFFAVVIGVVMVKTRSNETLEARVVAIASMLGLLAISVGWTLLSFVQGHYDGVATPRYGLVLLPFMAMVVVRSVPRTGLLVLGVVLPASAVIWQLSVGTF